MIRQFRKYFSKVLSNQKLLQNDDKVGLLITLPDKQGELLKILNVLNDHQVNLSYIQSKPSKEYSSNELKRIDLFIDVENKSHASLNKALKIIKENGSQVTFSNIKDVPWFPKSFIDLNLMGRDLKVGGEQLQSDHPGFNDPVYKKRRTEIETKSAEFKFGVDNEVPIIDYTQEEKDLWAFMWQKLEPLIKEHACDEFNECLEVLIKNKLFTKDNIPQVNEFNKFYESNSGMFLRPTGGLLSEREFLNSLAFKVFPCTQYIRHASKPLYTPEPDLVHEFMGHASMLANKAFVSFSQEIGLASLGASDEEIQKLATIYWYTIEFGLCQQHNKTKIYGGGILSSPSEILHAVSDKPKIYPFDLVKMSTHPVDITSIQQEYFLAPSFTEMVKSVKEYSNSIKKNFNVSYNVDSRTIDIDRKIVL